MRIDIRRIAAIKDGDVVGNAHPGQDREEQDGAALPRGRVRHHVRRGHLQGRRPARPGGNRNLSRSRARGSATAERIGQGRENAKQFLKDNTDIRAKLETEVRKTLGLTSTAEKAQAAVANAEAAPTPAPKGPPGRK